MQEQTHTLDLARIVEKFIVEHNWLKTEAEDLALQYQRYLIIIKKYGNNDMPIAPSREIDLFWHLHVQDTKKYAQDCEQFFGRFLHHVPTYPSQKLEDKTKLSNAYQNFLTLYQQEFGEELTHLKMLEPFRTITRAILWLKRIKKSKSTLITQNMTQPRKNESQKS